MRYQIDAPIISHTRLADCEYEMTLQAPDVAREARPGQFMQILYDHSYNPFTRRPFSVYHVDPVAGTFSIVYLARGIFTLGLRNKQAGETLSVVGPLGNWFEPNPDPDTRHVMVAGGVGAPPLFFLAQQLACQKDRRCRIAVINGARSRDLLVGVEEFAGLGVDLYFTTDDGSHGLKGIVTDALADLVATEAQRTHVYTCGPTAMMRAVADVCAGHNIPCQVSLETVMPCGLGVCMGCVVKRLAPGSVAGFTYARSCYEGPVFRAEDILWD